MEERFSGTWRILAAALFSAVLIAGAFLLARSVESPSLAQASTETALLEAIAAKDSDGDGLPDWEEALYGTNARNADTFLLGMTDGEAVARGLVVPKAISDISVATSSPGASPDSSLPPPPEDGTLTAAFAQTFFSFYIAAKQNNGGADLSESQMNDIAVRTLDSLSSVVAAAPDFKSANDLVVSGAGPDALRAFAAQAEAVLRKNKSGATTSELNYLKSALLDDDETALSHIASIAKGYRDSAVGLSVLPVPKELAAAHLALVNAMMRVSRITADFARANTDPLATMFALRQYPDAVVALGAVFTDIGRVYGAAGVSLPAGEPGASFVNLMKDLANEQAAQKP